MRRRAITATEDKAGEKVKEVKGKSKKMVLGSARQLGNWSAGDRESETRVRLVTASSLIAPWGRLAASKMEDGYCRVVGGDGKCWAKAGRLCLRRMRVADIEVR